MASPENRHCANCIGTLSFPDITRWRAVQRESVQKARDIRQLTARLADLNSLLADELTDQQRLVADYDRVRETARRALGVLRVVRDAEAVLAETKDRLLAVLADHHQQQQPAHH